MSSSDSKDELHSTFTPAFAPTGHDHLIENEEDLIKFVRIILGFCNDKNDYCSLLIPMVRRKYSPKLSVSNKCLKKHIIQSLVVYRAVSW